jgi:uncharacterized protein YigA (DUF484 family)
MTTVDKMQGAVRETILKAPEAVLDDRDVMRALVGANDRAMGENIIDMRGLAMDRLETRLGQLESTHQTVIAAAYENVAGMHAVHRAALALIGAGDFAAFLAALAGDAADAMRVDAVRLMIETADEPEVDLAAGLPELIFAEPGSCAGYLSLGAGRTDRVVTLRAVDPAWTVAYGPGQTDLMSEAVIRIDLGPGRLPAMLLLGASDPVLFQPDQATDLLAFFGGVVEQSMRRWLA